MNSGETNPSAAIPDNHEFFTDLDPRGLTINFSAQRQKNHWHTSIALEEIDIKTANGALADISARIVLALPNDFTSPLLVDILPSSQFTAAELTTDTIVAQHLFGRIAGRVDIGDETLTITLAQPTSISADHMTLRPNPRATKPPVNLTNLAIDPIVQFSASRNDLASSKITIQPGSMIALKSVITKTLTISGISGQLVQDSELFVNQSDGLSAKGGKWEFAPMKLTANEKTNIQLGASTINTHRIANENSNATIKLGASQIEHKNIRYAMRLIKGTLSLEDKVASAALTLYPKILPIRLGFWGRYDTISGRGSYRMNHPDRIDIHPNRKVFNDLITTYVPSLELRQGEIKFDLSGRIKHHPERALTHRLKINLIAQKLFAEHEKFTVNGLDIHGKANYPNSNNDGEPSSVKVHIEELDFGVMITDFNTHLELDYEADPENYAAPAHLNAIDIKGLSASAFSGQIKADPFRYQTNKPIDTIVHLTKLDIKPIIDMQKFDGLLVEGLIDGELPVHLDNTDLSIEAGQIYNHNQHPGLIQYQTDPNSLPGFSNALTDTVLLALSEFHYDSLEGDVNYEPNGDLKIDFRIEGKSPKLDTNRPVHFNVNSEQNVLSLLKSLQYTNRLNDTVDRTLGEHLNNRN